MYPGSGDTRAGRPLAAQNLAQWVLAWPGVAQYAKQVVRKMSRNWQQPSTRCSRLVPTQDHVPDSLLNPLTLPKKETLVAR
jgi:hypothetical protein